MYMVFKVGFQDINRADSTNPATQNTVFLKKSRTALLQNVIRKIKIA